MGLVIIIPLTAGLILLRLSSSMRFASSYLLVSEPVVSELMVVEGWISDPALADMVRIFEEQGYKRVLTTGGPLDPEVSLNKTGFYCLKPEGVFIGGDSIRLMLSGEIAQGVLPHFRVEVNNRVVGRDSARTGWNEYAFSLPPGMEKLDSLRVYFENDGHSYPEDRNLHLLEIRIGREVFPARMPGAVVYVGTRERFRLEESADVYTWAESCRQKLVRSGFPDSLLRAVPAPATSRNRTYTSALAVASYLQRDTTGIRSLNVYSEGVHARRTWHLYRHAFRGSGMETGIFSSSNLEHLSMDPALVRNAVLKEIAGNLYYRFVFNKRKLRREYLSVGEHKG